MSLYQLVSMPSTLFQEYRLRISCVIPLSMVFFSRYHQRAHLFYQATVRAHKHPTPRVLHTSTLRLRHDTTHPMCLRSSRACMPCVAPLVRVAFLKVPPKNSPTPLSHARADIFLLDQHWCAIVPSSSMGFAILHLSSSQTHNRL